MRIDGKCFGEVEAKVYEVPDHHRDVLESTATGCETMDSVRYGIFMKVNAERDRQDRLWGTEEAFVYVPRDLSEAIPEVARLLKAMCDKRAEEGKITWASILLEEVFEALEAETNDDREEELVQVMAVCAKIIEKMKAGKIPEGEVL